MQQNHKITLFFLQQKRKKLLTHRKKWIMIHLVALNATIFTKKGSDFMNINKLKGKIVENGINVEKLASLIGIDRSTFYRKLNNQGETFTVREVNLICKHLKLSKDEAMEIFFANYVA